MFLSDLTPEFGPVGLLVGMGILAYAVVGAPALGWWLYRRAARQDGAGRALTLCYLVTLVAQLVWTVAIVAATVLSPGASFGDLGLRAPSGFLTTVVPLLIGLVAFAAVFLGLGFLGRLRRRPAPPPEPEPEPQQVPGPYGTYGPPGPYGAQEPPSPPTPPDGTPRVAAVTLNPRTRAQRRLAFVVALVGGVTEELLYRGFLVALAVGLGLPWWLAAAVACLLFAWAHVYQGWRGTVGAGALGVLLMVLYVGTHSLWFAMICHVIVNVSLLLMTGHGRRHRAL